MAMELKINRDDNRPLYHQIAAQIRNQISTGQLPPGTRLPPIREISKLLGVNRITAHSAYTELQADGWIESTVGRGTFVHAHARPLAALESVGEQAGADGVLRDIYPMRQIPTLRSLAYAEPDVGMAPVDEFWGALSIARRDADSMIMYDSPCGDSSLRVQLVQVCLERGLMTMPDDIIVTSGAMQAISLAVRTITSPGDYVLVEEPTYLGMVHMMKMHGLNPIPITWDDEGPRLDQIERALRTKQPRFFYTVATFNNPTGKNITPARREALLRLAKRYSLYIIEDDVYGMISAEGAPPPPLKAADSNELVIYISGASKVLMPGLRIGWMIAPRHLNRLILSHRRAADLYGPPFIQRALAVYIRNGQLKAHTRRMLPIYRERRDALLRSLAHHMPPGVDWTIPCGGFSLWVTLPQPNMRMLYRAALEQGIAFTPGDAFMIRSGDRHLRLCYSCQCPDDIEDIVAILGRLIRRVNRNQNQSDDNQTTLYTSLV
jgi:DNA-binding transcriptional MocR family regulator